MNFQCLKLTAPKVKQLKTNIVNNDYQQYSKALYTFVPNKSFGQLLDISPQNFIFLKSLIQSFHTLKNGLLMKILNC